MEGQNENGNAHKSRNPSLPFFSDPTKKYNLTTKNTGFVCEKNGDDEAD